MFREIAFFENVNAEAGCDSRNPLSQEEGLIRRFLALACQGGGCVSFPVANTPAHSKTMKTSIAYPAPGTRTVRSQTVIF